jgi:butyrate kinase
LTEKPFILVINPGSTSTKIAVFEGEEEILSKSLAHSDDIITKPTYEQLSDRFKAVEDFFEESNHSLLDINCVVGRGGAFKPLSGGTYKINKKVIADVKEGNVAADHVSNLGSLIAYELANKIGVDAYFADPVSVDEFIPEARLSGIPELPRISLSHALNIRAVTHRFSKEIDKPYDEINCVVTHLGSGISVATIRKGRMIDVNNANDGGPFSPERAGSLPTTGFIKLCYSGNFKKDEMLKYATKNAGFQAYLNKVDMREIWSDYLNGDEETTNVVKAFIFQIVKEIGAMSSILKGVIDGIILTGGLAREDDLVENIRESVKWISDVYVYPGEDEMSALASAVFRVLSGTEKSKEYK